MRRTRALLRLCVPVLTFALGPAALTGCFSEVETEEEALVEPGVPPPAERPAPGALARMELVEALRSDLAQARHPSDGGGRAWLEDGGSARAGKPGRWTFVYEAGELGIAVGGQVLLQVSPFWGWSTPQTLDADGRGYTEATTDAPGVTLEARTLDEQLLGIAVGGRALAAGERIRIRYGAGPAGARADRFAERESPFFFAVDGDGDGVRKFLVDTPKVDVAPGPPSQLALHLPATAKPGDEVALTLAVLDAEGSAGTDFAGEIRFGDHGEWIALPETVTLGAADRGRTRVTVRVSAPGIVRIRTEGPEGLEAISNPMRVSPDAPRVLFGELHGHSNFSDGTGTPEDYYAYADEVAGLDFAALTDHDHWGIPFLDARPDMRERIARATEAAHAPGRFAALHGYEWTSWQFGHRHVVYFGDRSPMYSSIDPASDTPEELWALLRGKPALTFAHHSAGGPIPTDWNVAPDPELEPLTEVASVHGNSEASDAPAPIYRAVEGNWVRNALDRGYRLGFVGGSDSHDGHPGLAHIASGWSGLAAVYAEEATRPALREALADRRAYATNGPRILLDVRLAGHAMGRVLPVAELGEKPQLVVDVVGTGVLDRIDIVRSSAVVASTGAEGRADLLFSYPVSGLRAGEYLYVRAIQRDGGAAWSSPFFLE